MSRTLAIFAADGCGCYFGIRPVRGDRRDMKKLVAGSPPALSRTVALRSRWQDIRYRAMSKETTREDQVSTVVHNAFCPPAILQLTPSRTRVSQCLVVQRIKPIKTTRITAHTIKTRSSIDTLECDINPHCKKRPSNQRCRHFLVEHC
jgi:hypothetical protein